jgi:NADP-dependent 3-hydroxy acid dehydrogenase YdfG
VSRTTSALFALRDQYGASRVEVLAGDMGDMSVSAKAVELAQSRWGRLDGLVVNHGTLDPVKKIGDGDVKEWRRAFDVNVFGAVGLVSLISIRLLQFP